MKPVKNVDERAGFTVVELATATVLIGVLWGMFVLTTQSTSSAVHTGVAVGELDARAMRAMERVCESLKSTSADLITPQSVSPFSGDWVEYQRGLGADANGLLWGPAERLTLEYTEDDDGVDNDGDGLVDEGRLVWRESPGVAGERSTVLCQDVREYLEGETFDGTDENGNGLIDERGFALDFSDGSVTVRLSLSARDQRGQPLTATVERTIAFRNEGN